MLVRYFEKTGVEWRLRESIRSMVDFHEMNLMDAFNLYSGIDIVFLRNVLIYFDQNMRGRLFNAIQYSLKPEGCLMLGAAETTVFSSSTFLPLALEHSNMFYLKETTAPYQTTT
jgi:chemotaxis protein methyltransferase CheR